MPIREVPAPRARAVAKLLEGTPYVLVGSLGAGGMGEVFVVLHEFLGRRFALKLVHDHLIEHRGAVERLRLEARAMAQLQHPHVVEVVDFWITGGVPCLVLELLEGTSLAGELRRVRRLPVERAVRIGCEALSGLAAAHAAGVVHRDIKPENLFLDTSGALDPAEPTVKILDFGVARILEPPPDVSVESTSTGSLVGSARYMSPEARRAEKLDHRTDIYSMGVVLYEMLVGEGPFDYGRQELELPSRRLGTVIPEKLDRIVARALQLDREQRYPSAQEFLADLETLCHRIATHVPWRMARRSS